MDVGPSSLRTLPFTEGMPGSLASMRVRHMCRTMDCRHAGDAENDKEFGAGDGKTGTMWAH